MSSELQESTSSAETEDSKHWPETSKLGARIVTELGLDDSVDTLGRWMSHRIAELMMRAQEADSLEDSENAKLECTRLILRVWRRRTYWLRGQPLADLTNFLQQASELPAIHTRNTKPESLSWIESLRYFDELHKREHQVILDTAVASLKLTKEKRWLKETPDKLSEQERDTITWLVSRQEALAAKDFSLDQMSAPNFGKLRTLERSRIAFKTLNRIRREHSQLFSILKKSLFKSQL